ncbi:MAG: hypothetical protein ABW033_10600 [Acidimicrobiia bacterium]
MPADGDPSGARSGAGGTSRLHRGILGTVAGFFRSFWEQEESYHSPNAGVQLPPHPKEQQLAPPPNYARAGLVMLAAAGVAIGAYLPWISGHISGNRYELTGYQLNEAWGFTWVAAAFALAAMLGARRRVMGWVTMAMAVVVAGLVAKQLLDTHDMVTSLNRNQTNDLGIGVGLWIMLAAAAIGLIAAFRLDTPAEIV